MPPTLVGRTQTAGGNLLSHMQTFTPYADFDASVQALDQKRLGKQRVEVIQIVRALTVPGTPGARIPPC